MRTIYLLKFEKGKEFFYQICHTHLDIEQFTSKVIFHYKITIIDEYQIPFIIIGDGIKAQMFLKCSKFRVIPTANINGKYDCYEIIDEVEEAFASTCSGALSDLSLYAEKEFEKKDNFKKVVDLMNRFTGISNRLKPGQEYIDETKN